MRIHQLRSQGCEESGRDRTPPRSGRQGPARRVGCRLASLALAGAVGAAALLWAAPAQGAPTITSVETIHPYVLEVTLSEAIGPHGGREDAITVTVNGTDYPVWTATPMCAEKDKYGNCPGGFRWVWAVIGWPIFRNDTVRLSYSREAANRPLRNGSGVRALGQQPPRRHRRRQCGGDQADHYPRNDGTSVR